MSKASDRDAIAQLLQPVVGASGLDLDDVDITPAGRRRVVRVVVDSDSGVGLDEVARASHAVSEALDATDVLGGAPYTLEVTSPGVDRPLTEPRHWRRSVGRLVAVRGTDGRERTGRVVAAGDDSAELDVEGARLTVGYADVAKAMVQVEFNRPAAAAAPSSEEE
jgi:ribosome maturation factor RimP